MASDTDPNTKERRDADVRLRVSEEFNRSLMDASPDCVKVLDLDGRVLHMNAPGLCAMEIDDLGAVSGQQWEALWPQDARGDIERSVARALHGEVTSFQAYCPTAKSTPKWWEVTVSPVRDAVGGRVLQILSVSRDITQRKQAEDRLRASEANLRLSEERLNRLHHIISNPQIEDPERLQRLLRLGIEEFGLENGVVAEIAAGIYRVALADTPDGSVSVGFTCDAGDVICAETLRRNDLLAIDSLANSDWRGHRAYGEFGTEVYFGMPLPVGGEIFGTLCYTSRMPRARSFSLGDHEFLRLLAQTMGTEITRQQLVGKQTTADERQRFALQAASAGAWDLNIGTGEIVWSPENYALYDLDPALGTPGYKDWELRLHPDDRTNAIALVQDAVEGKSPEFRSEFRVVRRDGKVTWVLAIARVQRNASGTAIRLSGINIDITARKEADEKLRHLAAELSELNNRKDEFLATLAHELRNPLAPIRNGLQMMKLAGGQTATAEKARTMMERQLTQMVRLVDDLMDVSRINQGKLELRKEPIPLGAVLSSAVESSSELFGKKRHDLTINLPSQLLIVDADMTRLAQVFLNLLNNAAKYSDPGGHIQLNVDCQGSDAVVTVKDNGVGIAADQLPHVFEMFTQVNRSLDMSQGGLGIGLSLVKRLVEMHGGSVEGKSDGPGKGSEFVVRLPLVIEASQPQLHDVEDGPAAMTPSLRILVVDDNRDGADSLSEMLNLMGNDTRTAYDGQQGVDIAEVYRPDLVLLDIGLPKLNGYEACRHIRQQPWGKDTVLVAVTGWGQDKDRRRTREAGFDHHLVKPVDPQDLITLLAKLNLGQGNN